MRVGTYLEKKNQAKYDIKKIEAELRHCRSKSSASGGACGSMSAHSDKRKESARATDRPSYKSVHLPAIAQLGGMRERGGREREMGWRERDSGARERLTDR